MPVTDLHSMGSIDVLNDLVFGVVRFLFHFRHDNIGNEMRICCGVLQTLTGAVVMLVDECFDNEFERIIKVVIKICRSRKF